MRITSAGNVGIGNTAPASILQIGIGGGQDTTRTTLEYSLGGYSTTNLPSAPGSYSNGDKLIFWNDGTGKASIGVGNGYNLIIQATGTTTANIQFFTGSTTGVAGSERMRISANGNIGAPSGSNIYNASDLRLKQNITTITEGLDKIIALNPVKFNWLDGFEPSEDGKDMLGFIAQEVQSIIPEAVENFGNNSVTIGETIVENPLRVNEKFIIPVLVKAIQEMNTKIIELEKIVATK